MVNLGQECAQAWPEVFKEMGCKDKCAAKAKNEAMENCKKEDKDCLKTFSRNIGKQFFRY